MKISTRVRGALVLAGAVAMVASTSGVAGASSLTGHYDKAAAKLVPSVYKKVVLQVATDATYAPDEYMNGNTMVGFDVDLMKAIATTLGLRYKENNVTFDNIIIGIKGGHYQIGNSSFTVNKSREKQVNFVDYFQAGEGVYAKASSKIAFTGLKSFCGLTVAVETGTVEQSDAQSVAKTCPATKKATVLSFSTQTEANVAVSSGHAQVGFLDSQIADYVVAQSHGAFKSVGHAVNVAPYGIATPKTPAGYALARAIDAALKVLVANGTYHAILVKYGVQAGAIPASKMVLNGATS